jgi:hypothetical protein
MKDLENKVDTKFFQHHGCPLKQAPFHSDNSSKILIAVYVLRFIMFQTIHTLTHNKHHIINIRGDEKMLLHEGPRNQQNFIWVENDKRKYGKGKQTGWNLSIQQHLK